LYTQSNRLQWHRSSEGAEAFARDLKNVALHLLDTGHFALEEDGAAIANFIRTFLSKELAWPMCMLGSVSPSRQQYQLESKVTSTP
jgi:hypothetical protein